MQYLRQSTASQSVLIGPFVDSTDGVTAETGLTIANTDIRLSANGGNMAAKNSGGGTHDEAGWYSITLDATDTATVGRLQLSVAVAGALPVFAEFHVLEEAVYDALFAASAPGYLQPTTAGRTLDVTATGAAGIDWANVENQATSVDLSATAINLCDTVTTNTDMRGTDSASTHSAADVWSVATRVLTAGTNIGFPSAATIADAVWDQDTLNLTTGVGAFLVAMDARTIVIDNIVDDILVDTGTTIPGTITTLQGNVTDILTDTGTTLPAQITALNNLSAAAVNAEVDTAISEYFGVAGSSLTGIPWNAAWDAEVQSECTDAINALFTFTAAGFVDANIQKINDVNIVGNGVSPKFGV